MDARTPSRLERVLENAANVTGTIANKPEYLVLTLPALALGILTDNDVLMWSSVAYMAAYTLSTLPAPTLRIYRTLRRDDSQVNQ